jgi:hypothetical protein
MWGIKNIRLVDYMCINGVFPEYERYGITFFKTSEKFRTLLDRYYIEYTLMPNRLGSY